MRKVIGQQGEVKVIKIDVLPDGLKANSVEKIGSAWIISHSEKGHHHVIDGNVEVLERVENVPAGMRILYALVKEPTALKQLAPDEHGKVALEPGIYELRRAREFNPFLKEARAVAD